MSQPAIVVHYPPMVPQVVPRTWFPTGHVMTLPTGFNVAIVTRPPVRFYG